ncbi:hypothetical protein AgCh_028689 [Apium graveolens]
MAPAEMKESTNQSQEFLDKGVIRPSYRTHSKLKSIWEHSGKFSTRYTVVVIVVRYRSGTLNPEVEEQQRDDVLLLIGDHMVDPIERPNEGPDNAHVEDVVIEEVIPGEIVAEEDPEEDPDKSKNLIAEELMTRNAINNFQELRKRLVTSPVLALPDGKKGDFVIYSDASHKGLRCVLMQHGKEKKADNHCYLLEAIWIDLSLNKDAIVKFGIDYRGGND